MRGHIYIAGPDVFSPGSKQIGDKYKAICTKYGFVGLYPLDNECTDAQEIFQANLRMIDRADYVVANLNNFRGIPMDDGTAFEIGYAFAKGKIIYGYLDDARSMTERFGKLDANGYAFEGFGLPINLMIWHSATIINGTFEDCIRAI